MAEIKTRDRVEFESVVRRTDVQLSKPFSTGLGDETVRALVTSSGSVILTPVSGDDIISTVVVTSDETDVVELSFGDLWKTIKAVAGAVLDAIKDQKGDTKGGDCSGSVNVTVNVTGTGSIGSLTVDAKACQQ
jgi:hypothetical protein